MMELDPNSSVRNEQSGDTGNMDESRPEEKTENPEGNAENSEPIQSVQLDIPEPEETSELNNLPSPPENLPSATPEITSEEVEKSIEQEEDLVTSGSKGEEAISTKKEKSKKVPKEESSTKAAMEETEENISELEAIRDEVDSDDDRFAHMPEKIDYTMLSKEDLVKVLKDLVSNAAILEIKTDVDLIKSLFYKKHHAEVEEIKNKFLADGGLLQDFKIEEHPEEIELKELLNKYREFRNDYSKRQDEDKESNLAHKYKIIESLKELSSSQESLNKTFHEFRDLQNQWHQIGSVPQQNLKDLWESYHYQVETFYDFIKINKELRDLDLKKNLESKMVLCEKAEELLLESSVVEAFRKLQKLHDGWRETGPVPIDKRTEIWERFKMATTKINRKHQEYFVTLKQDQKKNYDEKIVLCEKAEEIAALEIENHKDWEDKSRELVELQKIWKTIGFAPKKYNTLVYDRFRKACDDFFEKKRSHYSLSRDEQQGNLQTKIELCIQAEALQNSQDWKRTTDELISLQKKWKTVGPVPAKLSDKVWKRFRSACDKFFSNKAQFFSQADTRYEENLELKNKLIAEIEAFELTTDVEKNLNTLKEFQRKWTEIGFVPIKQKVEIQERYRQVINDKFDQLKVDDNKKAVLKFRTKLEGIAHKPNSDNRLSSEREKFFVKLKQLESDIILWENNIGFFANSKNAEAMIADVRSKIEQAREKVAYLKDCIRMLDDYEE